MEWIKLDNFSKSLNTARGYAWALVFKQQCFAGGTPWNKSVSLEVWNGTSWTTQNNLSTARWALLIQVLEVQFSL
jgi:hypothetical protein